MSSDPYNKRPRKAPFSFRALMNIAMGILYLVLAGVIISVRKFGTIDLSGGATAYLLGGLLGLYGIFRIWRGIQDYKLSRDPDSEY